MGHNTLMPGINVALCGYCYFMGYILPSSILDTNTKTHTHTFVYKFFFGDRCLGLKCHNKIVKKEVDVYC